MKNIILSLLIFFSTLTYAQSITGKWNGVLKVQGTQLRLVFNIVKSGNVYVSTMDSPDQGAKGIPVISTSFENSILTIKIGSAGIQYKGTLGKDNIIGIFKQGSFESPMNLTKKTIKKETARRLQEPTKPYPYYSENVSFKNEKANISLVGTLTLPKKRGYFQL